MSSQLSCRPVLLLLFVTFISACSINAQTITGSISGVVTDSNGGVVPGARVNLVNDKTGGTRTVLTFLAIMNGPSPRKIDIGLDFLGRGNRRAVLVRDDISEPAAVKIEHTTANDKTTLSIEMRSGGGFIGMFG